MRNWILLIFLCLWLPALADDYFAATELEMAAGDAHRKGDYQKNYELLSDGIRKFPDKRDRFYLSRATNLFLYGYPEQALKDADAALDTPKGKEPSDAAFIRSRRACFLLGLGRYQEALDDGQQARLILNPSIVSVAWTDVTFANYWAVFFLRGSADARSQLEMEYEVLTQQKIPDDLFGPLLGKQPAATPTARGLVKLRDGDKAGSLAEWKSSRYEPKRQYLQGACWGYFLRQIKPVPLRF